MFHSTINLYNCVLDSNLASYGGGICSYYSDTYLSGVTVKNNHSYDRGGGIVAVAGSLRFDSVNLCNIYLNYSARGTDIYKQGCDDTLHVYVDTFTVLNPDYYYLYSDVGYGQVGNDITYNINTGKIESTTQDLYISPEGNNLNSGLNPDEPLKDICFALLKMASDSISPDTIHIANGYYAPSTGEKFPLSIKGHINIKGENRDSTILDAEDEIYLLHGIFYADNYHINNITLQHGNGDKNSPYGFGSFDFRKNSASCLENILVIGNTGRQKSGGNVTNSNKYKLINVEFRNNVGGGACSIGHADYEIYCDTVTLIDCKFIYNLPDYSIPPDQGGSGGGLSVIGDAVYPDLITTKLYN